MKKKLTNTRVINSIGIGILAAITAGTPVLAALNNSFSEDSSVEPVNASETSTEPVEAAASQNGEIVDTISEAQATIQEVRDELNQISGENVDDLGAVGGGISSEEEGTSEMPTEPEAPSGETDPVDESQPSGDGETSPEETDEQTPPEEGGDSEAPETTPGTADPETPETTPGTADPETPETTPETTEPETPETPSETTEPETPVTPPEEGGDTDIDTPQTPGEPETNSSTIDEALEKTQDALENIKNDELVVELDKKNEEARDAIDHFNGAVENPNNFIGSIVDIISDASSAVVNAADAVAENEKIAKDQAQAAIDAQVKVYDSREEAAAAQQQAQAAAAEAEAAYNSALITVEEAENNKAIADERLTDLERQLAEADAALNDMQIKVQEAQEALLAVLEKYGLKPGEFNPEDLKGDVLEAYTNVQDAVNIAEQEFKTARDNYDAVAGEVQAAMESYEEAATVLDNSNKDMEKATSNLENKTNEWKTAQVDEKIAKYNEGLKGTEKVYIEVAAAEKALKDAKDALESAQRVKEKTDNVLDNAKAAVEAAKEEEVETAQEAAAAAIEATNAIKENREDAIRAAEVAAQSAKKAADQVQRDLTCLGAAKKDADQAQKDLDEARKAVSDATEKRDAAQERYNNMLAEWDQSKNEAIEEQIEVVSDLLSRDFDWKNENGTTKYALATQLLVFQLLYEDKEFTEIKAGDPSKGEIIVVGLDDEPIPYYFRINNNELEVCKGTNVFINAEKFKDSASEFENECSEKESNLQAAQENLSNLEEKLTEATKAEDKAEVISVLVDMKETLRAVQQEAENLVQAEKQQFEKKNGENSLLDTLSVALNNLIAGGDKYEEAKDTLGTVTEAQTEVENTLKQLADLSYQEDWDQEAYDDLLDAYQRASIDHSVAVEALEKCVEGLNSAKTEKDRARVAANAVFSYILDDNVRPTTPTNPTTPSQPETTDPTTPTQPGTTDSTTSTQPGTNAPAQPVTPIEPVYGTLIDTVTTPVIGDRGVSSEAGDTGYTGYIYRTLGGRIAYTAPTAEVPEGELVSVEDEEVPLAEVGATTVTKTNNTKTTRKVSDAEVPLADVKTESNKISWWWILVIALLGATGTELYIRHKNKEDEKKAKGAKQDFVKI